MAKIIVEITNEMGLHARPAALFVQTASRFKSEIKVSKDNHEVDGKSILGLMTLAARKGSQLTIEAQGEDEEQAVAALAQLVAGGFNG